MIIIIGWFLLLLSILFDEGTTFLLIMKGLGSLETNILASRFGIVVWFIVIVCAYFLFFWGWAWGINSYKKNYEKKVKGYKLLDVFVFLACFVLVFIVFFKLEAGYSNLNFIMDTFHEEKLVELKQSAVLAENYSVANKSDFVKIMDQQYFEGVTNLNYFKMIFIVVCSYLLFRVGHKVSPYEFA